MIVKMALEDLKRWGLPREALYHAVRLYAHAATGRKEAPRPWEVREAWREAERLPLKPPLDPATQKALVARLPRILVEVPLRLLSGEGRSLEADQVARAERLLRKGLSGLEIAVLFLWEEAWRRGGNWWELREKVLSRLRDPKWDLLLARSYTALRARGLDPERRTEERRIQA